MLATKISLMNELANIAEHLGADIESVRHGIGSDQRIGYHFIYPGPGYGGSCFPKDVKALIAIARDYNYDFSLLKATDAVNDEMRLFFVEKIKKHFDGNLKGKKLALLGLSFKPDTDDMRFAPSITIANALIKEGATVIAYDPVTIENAKKVMPKELQYATNPYEAAHDADAVVVVTEWNEFRQLDLVKLAKELKNRVLFDGRNIYDPQKMRDLGYMYYCVGRM